MTPERWGQIKEILYAAVGESPDRRSEFLGQACGEDAALRAEVERLLTEHDAADRFLESPFSADAALRSFSGSHRLNPNQLIADRFRIVSFLAEGGMGVLYKAEDTRLSRFVVLKFLSHRGTSGPQAVARLRREARAASALNHPNISTIHNVVESEGKTFIVMEYLEGFTLRQLMAREQSGRETGRAAVFSIEDSLRIARQIADALAAAHAHGLVHRDIKPTNILVTAGGQAKILDFGLAKSAPNWQSEGGLPTPTAFESLTTSGAPMGTLAYMSPEQARNELVDTRSDLFSFGAVLYEMVTGRKAFPGEAPALIFDAILNRTPMAPGELNPDLPADLETVITKALQKDRERRYQSAVDLLRDLSDVDARANRRAGKRAQSRTASSHIWPIMMEVLLGLSITVALLVLKGAIGTSTPGRLLNEMLTFWVQARPSFRVPDLPVAVVDISKLDAVAVAGRPSPRAQLEDIIAAIAKKNPAAIGIDVDFSPEDGSWTQRGGPQFFDFLQRLRMPVYLGVSRSRYSSSAAWLGAEEYRAFAASIAVSADDISEMPLWIGRGRSGTCLELADSVLGPVPEIRSKGDGASGKDTTCLPSISLALARGRLEHPGEAPRWPSSLFKPFDEEAIDKATGTYAGLFVPNFSVANHLQEQTSSAVVSGDTVLLALNPALTSLEGKVVLLGNTEWDATLDKYPIPPWHTEAPGVYFHACAAYTLIRGALLGITTGARVGLDLLVATIALMCLAWWHCHRSDASTEKADWQQMHLGLTSFFVMTILVGGYGLVQYARILWTDPPLIAVALIFESVLAPVVLRDSRWPRAVRPGVAPGWPLNPRRQHHAGQA